MRDYQEIFEDIRECIELKEELNSLPAEVLKNSKKEIYSRFLNIEYSLKNQIFNGEELLGIFENIYTEYEQKIEEKEDKEKQIDKLLNNLEKIIKGKEGTIINELKEKMNEYK